MLLAGCYTEKATPARPRPERQHNARSNRRKQCSPSETKPYANPTPPRKRQNTPTNGHTPRRMKPTHTRLTYTRMPPHAPSHQAGDHPVPAHSERHNPPKLWTQRQSGLPPRAASSEGQWHRCRSSRKESVWGSQAGGGGHVLLAWCCWVYSLFCATAHTRMLSTANDVNVNKNKCTQAICVRCGYRVSPQIHHRSINPDNL